MSQVLKPTTDLANRIAQVYPSLSGTHRRAADFVLQNPLETATMTIEGFAERSGASTATVTRFVRALGYGGYSEFRAALTAALRLAMAPVDSLADAHSTKSSAFSTFVTAIKDQAANLDEALAAIDEETCSRAMEALLRARRIFIVGSGASHHVGAHLEEGLTLYLDANVIFASSRGGPEKAIRHIMNVGADDLVLAISLPRYSRGTVDLAKLAKSRGATVLALTDAPSSPLVPIADMTFFAPARNRLLPNSPAATFALADAIVAAVARERPDAVAALKELSESLLWTFYQ
ncbi:MurR/RpiR family transcriptional regulator [Microvirga sp. ACRRW]|uniref:MurR/RpiR family transcriptional regulator n=1 Tax=Microvirga sp. ACRRW TaxID=2918205 RepID=UPI001EF63C02|nr:MurR/RpiR family transcriptional regulator [Microvirga sp. ACRRW]MCG7393720.1 MurR/RpiR family transcriptional regulator [Microvirga sp. ACRRW]